VRIALLSSVVAASGCVATPSLPAQDDSRDARVQSALGIQAQRTGGGRTTTVGLPLTRAQKIGLWTGVAVVLAYVMADDNEENSVDEP
jgi:hypothetical protein